MLTVYTVKERGPDEKTEHAQIDVRIGSGRNIKETNTVLKSHDRTHLRESPVLSS